MESDDQGQTDSIVGLAKRARDLLSELKEHSRRLAHNRQIALDAGESAETLTEEAKRIRQSRNSLSAKLGAVIHETWPVLERLADSDFPAAHKLKRDLQRLILQERPISRLEDDWIVDRVLAFVGLLEPLTARTAITDSSRPQIAERRKPGRPSRFPFELKSEALRLKESRTSPVEVAKVLYGEDYAPGKEKNIYSTLKRFKASLSAQSTQR